MDRHLVHNAQNADLQAGDLLILCLEVSVRSLLLSLLSQWCRVKDSFKVSFSFTKSLLKYTHRECWLELPMSLVSLLTHRGHHPKVTLHPFFVCWDRCIGNDFSPTGICLHPRHTIPPAKHAIAVAWSWQSLLSLLQPQVAEPFPELRFVDFLPFRQQDCVWRPGSFMQSRGGFS